MDELALKQFIKRIRANGSLIIFLIGFSLAILLGINLMFSTSIKRKTAGTILNQAASIEADLQTDDHISINSSDLNADNSQKYTIKNGDSLWKIATENYSDPFIWTEIYQLNIAIIGSNPNIIFPGTEIILPDR